MKHLLLLLSIFVNINASAQSLPIIHANSKSISIRDGEFLDKNSWSINPSLRPDVYTADRTRETKYVTFYTDVDSIRVKVTPGSRFDFIVLYQGKDSCYTSIQSGIQPSKTLVLTKPDTIPFRLTSYNAIAIKAVINNTDTLNVHFDLSAFGFHLIKSAILQKTNLLPNRADVLAGTAQPNYRRLNKVSTIQIGTLTLNNPVVGATDVTAHEMDGRLGWDIFDGLVVELNYERNILVIHPALPQHLKGYKKSSLTFIRSFPSTAATIVINHKKYAGYYLLDDGSDQSLIIDSTWAAQANFPANLPVVSSITLHDPRGKTYISRKVSVEAVKVNSFTATNIPALLLGSQNPAGIPINLFGNALLKRFDLFVDFQKDKLYIKPNGNS